MEISWISIWRILLAVALVAIVYAGLNVVLGLFVAIVIAAALDGPVTSLQKKGIPRLISALLIFILGILIVAALIYAIVPIALAEFTNLIFSLKDYSGPILDFLKASEALGTIGERLNVLADSLLSGDIPLLQVATSIFGGIFLAIAVLILAFYLTVGQDGVEKFLTAVVPPAYENNVLDLYFRVRGRIGRWLKGQLVLSFIIWIAVFVGLWLLDVEYALLLSILAAIFELIPFVGPVFSGALAVILSLATSLQTALYVLILFVVIQQIENHILVPGVMKFTTSLNPAVVLISLILGGAVFGFVGLILAVPAAVLLEEVVADWTTTKQRRRGLGL